MKRIKFVGLDVHAETIAVAVAEQDGEVRTLGVIPNREESIRKLVKKLGPVEQLCFCYEAGPTGYVVYWQLTALGAKCEVVAPTLVPVKSGERVKTDRFTHNAISFLSYLQCYSVLLARPDSWRAPLEVLQCPWNCRVPISPPVEIFRSNSPAMVRIFHPRLAGTPRLLPLRVSF
jgi:hypothetical protein